MYRDKSGEVVSGYWGSKGQQKNSLYASIIFSGDGAKARQGYNRLGVRDIHNKNMKK